MSTSTLKSKLDRIFSEYIRRRDAGENGYVRCISCGKIVHWEQSDAGHYVNRKHMSLRYDEKNVNAQCRDCNRFNEGNMIGYAKGLIAKYGQGVIDYLDVKRFNACKMTEFELGVLVKEYRDKLKFLNK